MKGFRVRYAKSKKEGTNEIVTCFEGVKSLGVRAFYRGANEEAGSEYHTGEDPSKRPERFFIASGEMEFNVCNGLRRETIKVEKGTEVEIDPLVWHATCTLTDVIYLKPIQPGKKVDDTVHITLEDFRERFRKNELYKGK